MIYTMPETCPGGTNVVENEVCLLTASLKILQTKTSDIGNSKSTIFSESPEQRANQETAVQNMSSRCHLFSSFAIS